jgi:hypothetical protein
MQWLHTNLHHTEIPFISERSRCLHSAMPCLSLAAAAIDTSHHTGCLDAHTTFCYLFNFTTYKHKEIKKILDTRLARQLRYIHRWMNTLPSHSNTMYHSVLCITTTLAYRLYYFWFYSTLFCSILFHWHVQNATIPCCSQQLLPFLSVIYFSCHSSPSTILPSSLTSSCRLS